MQFLSDHVQEMKRSQEVRRPAGLPWHPAPGYLEPVTSGRVCPPGPSAASQDPGFVGNSVISLVWLTEISCLTLYLVPSLTACQTQTTPVAPVFPL